MDLYTFFWTTFGIFVTLSIFSFLYKDNPFYKFAEHLVVGTSAGYFVIILWHNGLVPNLFQRLSDGDWYFLWLNSTQPWYIIPAILGALMWTRFSKNYSWVSRWPMAMYIGIATGMAIPREMANRINKQLVAMMDTIHWDNFFGSSELYYFFDPYSGLSESLIFIGSMSALIYFFFSKAHSGWFGRVAGLGIWTLMIGFGASFGYTVMARISLFINRIQDFDDWRAAAFNTANPNYSAVFQLLFWLLALVVIGYIAYEITKHVKGGGEQTESPG
jgi:hypothetical protein